MPSHDQNSNGAYDLSSHNPISQMTYAECTAEHARAGTRMRYIQQELVANIAAGMERNCEVNRELEQRIGRLRNRLEQIARRVQDLVAQHNTAVAQNAGYGSMSRDRSPPSPPAPPRAPNSSPQH
ncbi:hypothetical protein EAE96_009622 [Botrytis aclada]|nr:hypothetical protein EAE96_009622 [Botrytis aclada]